MPHKNRVWLIVLPYLKTGETVSALNRSLRRVKQIWGPLLFLRGLRGRGPDARGLSQVTINVSPSYYQVTPSYYQRVSMLISACFYFWCQTESGIFSVPVSYVCVHCQISVSVFGSLWAQSEKRENARAYVYRRTRDLLCLKSWGKECPLLALWNTQAFPFGVPIHCRGFSQL